MNMNNLLNELPYKIKTNKNPAEIKEYIDKQNRKNRFLAVFFFILGALNLILLLLYITEEHNTIGILHTVMLIIQVIIFPFLGYQLFRRIKLNTLSEEEVKEGLK